MVPSLGGEGVGGAAGGRLNNMSPEKTSLRKTMYLCFYIKHRILTESISYSDLLKHSCLGWKFFLLKSRSRSKWLWDMYGIKLTGSSSTKATVGGRSWASGPFLWRYLHVVLGCRLLSFLLPFEAASYYISIRRGQKGAFWPSHSSHQQATRGTDQ